MLLDPRFLTKISARLFLACGLFLVTANASQADLYGHWPLDDGEGDTAKDLSSNEQHGEIYDYDFLGLGDDGSVWVDDDERGMVMGIAGAWVDAGELPVMDLDNDFSWALWTKQSFDEPSPSNNIIIGNRFGFEGSDTSPREFIKFTPNRFEYHMNAGFDNDLQYDPCDCPERHIPSDEEWMHHVVVKDGEVMTYFRDGELMNDTELLDPQFSEDPLPFAMGGQDGRETWTGYLSDVRLYDHALTEAEVASIFSGAPDGDPGDFNGDTLIDAKDIDLLTAEVIAGTNDILFDLTGDNLVNYSDRDAWVNDIKNTWYGDSNLDGEFNSTDFVVVFSAAEFEDLLENNSGWATGDWNGDQEFNSSDFVTAFQAGGFEAGPKAAAAQLVPEPNTAILLLLGFLGFFATRRR
ncbi:MAG: LamG domain-containing protein [Planctomycetaceae bacterium]|nr:LamG domain-containing protein [Planctomycetaceae bacterium]